MLEIDSEQRLTPDLGQLSHRFILATTRLLLVSSMGETTGVKGLRPSFDKHVGYP